MVCSFGQVEKSDSGESGGLGGKAPRWEKVYVRAAGQGARSSSRRRKIFSFKIMEIQSPFRNARAFRWLRNALSLLCSIGFHIPLARFRNAKNAARRPP